MMKLSFFRSVLFVSMLAAMFAPSSATAAPPTLLETIAVSNSNPVAVLSATTLDPDHMYRIVASGQVSDWTTDPSGMYEGSAWGVDALYCYKPSRCGSPQTWRQLRINDLGLDELASRKDHVAYSPNHTYSVEFDDVAGQLSLVMLDAISSASDNSGAITVQLFDLGAAPARKITFALNSYVNNVRGLPRYQLGVSRFRGSGELWGQSMLGDIGDSDDLTFYNLEDVHMKVVGYSYSSTPHAVRQVLKLTVEITSNNRVEHCPIGTRGTVTIVDDKHRMRANNGTKDSVAIHFPSPPCPTHNHGVTNHDNPNTNPTAGGVGGGQWVIATIKRVKA